MQVRRAQDAQKSPYASTRQGVINSRALLEGKAGTPNNFKFSLISSETDYDVVRHRHDFDQIRFVLAGEFGYGNGRVISPGFLSYFPEGQYYGPQSRKPGTLMAICQFGGANGNGYYNKEEKKLAIEALEKKGTFDKGIFTWFDEKGQKHNQDSFEAISEYMRGHKLKYAKPRYDDVLTFDPDNFSWIQDKENPGIAYKWIGTFTERETRLGFIRIDAGATFQAGLEKAPEILFITKGAVTYQGEAYGLHSAFHFEAGEGPVAIAATEETEILSLRLPRF